MMYIMKYMSLLLFFASFNALAEMPFTFSAGQPAVANEVNNNFSFLENRIEILETAPIPTPSKNCSPPLDGVEFTYTKKTIGLGSTFLVGETTFVLIRFEFIDILRGNAVRYIMTLPAPTTFNANDSNLRIKYSMIDPESFCSFSTISGFPSNNSKFNANSVITYDAGASSNSIQFNITKNVEILVGSTLVSFRLYSYQIMQNLVFLDPGNTDYSRSYNLGNMEAPIAFIQQMDDLMDYIVIEMTQ